jgi:hypothetical protein
MLRLERTSTSQCDDFRRFMIVCIWSKFEISKGRCEKLTSGERSKGSMNNCI